MEPKQPHTWWKLVFKILQICFPVQSINFLFLLSSDTGQAEATDPPAESNVESSPRDQQCGWYCQRRQMSKGFMCCVGRGYSGFSCVWCCRLCVQSSAPTHQHKHRQWETGGHTHRYQLLQRCLLYTSLPTAKPFFCYVMLQRNPAVCCGHSTTSLDLPLAAESEVQSHKHQQGESFGPKCH